MNLVSALSLAAGKNPSKTAIFYGEEEISYAVVEERIKTAAIQLAQHGGRAGQPVGLWIRNCPGFVTAFFAVLRSGGVVVPINNFLKPREVSAILEDASIGVVLIDESMEEAAKELRELHPGLRTVDLAAFREKVEGGEEISPETVAKESDLAVLIYSSGTTGLPKGIMLSHGNLLHNVESCRKVLEAVGEDRIVVILPLFHSFMLTVGMLLPLLVGGSMVLIKSLNPPKNILQELMHRRATLLPSVPQFFRTLCHDSIPRDLPLRLCISGGAPLPVEIFREFKAKFSIPLLEGYGLSEASPVVAFNPIRGPWKEGSIGVPVDHVEVSVQDDEGKFLGARETGEICVRGRNVMIGYWKQPEETRKALRGDWLLTGDIGYRDEDGYYYITDRKKDMLLVNGINVFPREIEEVLYRYPGVREVAIVGISDPRRGEQPVAFISAAGNVTLSEKEILQFVREQVAEYKVPRKVIFLERLPRNATGKILKRELRAGLIAKRVGPI